MINPSLLALMQLMPPQKKTKAASPRMATPRSGTTKASGAIAPAAPRMTAGQNKAIGQASAISAPVAPVMNNLLQPPTLRDLPDAPTLYDPTARKDFNLSPVLNMFAPVGGAGNFSTPSDMERFGSAQDASLPRSPLALQAVQNKARLAGLQMQLQNGSDTVLPKTPYAPPAMPQREQVALPDRPNLAPPEAAQIMSALAGLINPQNAGNFYAVPYQAAQVEGDRQYADTLNRTAFEQQQADTRFGDAVAGRGDAIQTEMYNRDAEWRRMMEDYRRTQADAAISGGISESQSLLDALNGVGGEQGLIAQDEAAMRSGIQAGRIGSEINAGLAGNQSRQLQYAAEANAIGEQNQKATEDYRKRLELAASLGDKAAQRELAARGQDVTMRGQDLNFALGADRNAISRFSAETGRLNAQTSLSRLAFEQWQKQQEMIGKVPTMQEYVQKSPDVMFWNDRAKSLMDKVAGSGTPRNTTDNQVLNMYEQSRKEAIDRATSDYYAKYNMVRPQTPHAPVSMFAPPNPLSAAERNIPVKSKPTMGTLRLDDAKKPKAKK